ncbi:MAG: ABC transporter substrate-binding protein [Dermatophilaceae bacterium]
MSRRTLTFAMSVLTVGALAACGSSSDPLGSSTTTSAAGASSGSAASTSIVVGSADFSESVLLAEIYAGALKAKGVNATTKLNIGSREIYLKALDDGSIDVVPEYTGALAYYYDKNFAETDPTKVYDGLTGLLPDTLQVLKASAAEDNDSINVTAETAKKNNLKSIADLKPVAGELTLGAPPEFKERPQGIPGLTKTYGVTFGSFRPLKGAQLVQALKNGQVQAANIFSTDPAIAANGFVTLTDDQRLFGSQNVVPLLAKSKNSAEVTAALDAVSAKLTTAVLSDLLKQTDIDKADPQTVAAKFLADNGLG